MDESAIADGLSGIGRSSELSGAIDAENRLEPMPATEWQRLIALPAQTPALDRLRSNTVGTLVVIGSTTGSPSFPLQPENSQLPGIATIRSGTSSEDPWGELVDGLARLYVMGATIDWEAYQEGRRARRLPLPTYPFERQRFWVLPSRADATAAAGEVVLKTPVWRPALTVTGERWAGGVWLVLADPDGIGDEIVHHLALRGAQAILVRPGEYFGRPAPDQYTIRVAVAEDYVRVLQQVESEWGMPRGICHLWAAARDGRVPHLADVDTTFASGVESVVALLRAVSTWGRRAGLELWIVTADAIATGKEEGPLHPERAALVSLAQVAAQESRDLLVRVVDATWKDGEASALASCVLQELLRGSPEPTVAAYRAGRLLQRDLLPIQAATVEKPAIEAGRVWWIVGGLGDLGFEVASHLAAAGSCRLVLTGRTRLPPRLAWQEYLANEAPTAIAKAVRRVMQLEAMGAEVLLAPGDVSDLQEMQEAAQLINDRYGGVYGVIHAAGVAGQAKPVQKLDSAALSSVLRGKARGGLVLDTVSRDLKPTHFIFFSSLSALYGGLGFGDYAAANAFLDVLAHLRRSQGLPALAINWAGWRDRGLETQAVYVTENRPQTLTVDEALAAFDAALPSGMTQVVVEPSTPGFPPLRPTESPPHPSRLLSEATSPALSGLPVPPGELGLPAQASPTKQSPGPSGLLATIRKALASLLSAPEEELDADAPLVDFGMDSRIGLQFLQALEEQFAVELPLTLLADHPSLAAVARYLHLRLSPSPGV
ncbi:MAG: SDR family NAD(P)-dependent oxidoreductase [Chloroflexi bacterium]|nr:MAG: SDR family NAD(P)-dependent oxidoreductase [Chloroflexota bacterium]